jgi:hypothetical protein
MLGLHLPSVRTLGIIANLLHLYFVTHMHKNRGPITVN